VFIDTELNVLSEKMVLSVKSSVVPLPPSITHSVHFINDHGHPTNATHPPSLHVARNLGGPSYIDCLVNIDGCLKYFALHVESGVTPFVGAWVSRHEKLWDGHWSWLKDLRQEPEFYF
jgi:hypothetical protein